jgi:hypothetical protein
MNHRSFKRLSAALGGVGLLVGVGVGAAHAQAADNMPFMSLAYFTGACPDGWTGLSGAKGRTLLPSPLGGGVGTMADANDPLSPGQAPEHTHHKATGQVSTSSKEFVLVGSGPNHSPGKAGTYPMSGSTKSARSNLPYIQYNVCLKTAQPSGEGTIPDGVMSFQNMPMCPSGWQEYSAAKGRHIVALPKDGQPAASFGGKALAPGELRTHTHDIEGTISFPSHNIAGASGCCAHGYAGADTQRIHGGSTQDDTSEHKHDSAVLLPYYTATLCRK